MMFPVYALMTIYVLEQRSRDAELARSARLAEARARDRVPASPSAVRRVLARMAARLSRAAAATASWLDAGVAIEHPDQRERPVAAI